MQFRFNSLLALTGLMIVAGLHPAGAQTRAAQSVPGELLVRWKSQRAPLVLAPGVSPARWQQSDLRSSLSARLPGARLKRVFAASGWSLVKVPAGQSAEQARAALAKSLGAANVSLNSIRHATRVPNDPSYGVQWHWPKIKAPDAWNKGTGTRDVVVAVLDSGVDLNHADLKANLWKNPREIENNGVDDDNNGYVDDVYGLNGIDPNSPPQDGNGHGTHVAGLIGAVGNNSTDVTGACWSVKIMTLRFLDDSGTGDGDDAAAIACLEYAIKMKQNGVNLRAINHSYVGPDNPPYKEAFQAAESAGILQICAAGNGSNNIDEGSILDTNKDGIDERERYPAFYRSSTNIAVGASTQSDSLAGFSNFGAQSVDLVAPGDGIASLRLGGGIFYESGTSMASPIVAGAAALVSSLEPSLSASALKSRLISTVDKVATLQGKVKSAGRLNLARAITPISYEIKGQVYRLDGAMRVPLAAAKVVLSGKAAASVMTDGNGRYSFSSLSPGAYGLAATLRGYTFNTANQTFPAASGTTSTLDFQATSVPSTFYTLFGVARDAAGTPVAGVSIFLNTAPTSPLATTDAAGKYAIAGRSAGTYTLKASGGNFNWSATPGSIALPDSAREGRAEVNFRGVLIDKVAPAISISTPAEGATFAPGNQLASGTAGDATGNKEIYLELTRFLDFTPSYYNWTTRQWVSTASVATTLTRPVSGKTTNWSATLPSLSPANYSLRVWGRDTLGNVSRGEADAFSSFSVVKPAASAPASGGAS